MVFLWRGGDVGRVHDHDCRSLRNEGGEGMTDPSGLEKLLNPGGGPTRSPGPPNYLAPVLDNPGKLEYQQLEMLEDAARACDVVANFVRSGISRTGRPTDAAAKGLKGFGSAGQLSALVDSWASGGKTLADHIDGLGPRLNKTASAYRQAEDKIRSSINKVWNVVD
ncbi:WXG100 family type VII secretion target [Actinomadura rubrisoli]|uniref:Uncharacterized protein n=1 Tax=Actinomadura rubrisoli TaxID=2530368 RepID=A0A4R5B378_9ACTN|nr:hypothetical protein [Actinomadura rubrisoli]TDD79169.1 hypothetical protein E1298_28395 [Actinomadura rubrisoli]